MRRPSSLQTIVVLTGLAPAGWLLQRLWTNDLGANPIEELTHTTGLWALWLLLACLAITPIRRLAGLRQLAPLRRTLGLLSFTYACAHVGVYAGLDRELSAAYVLEDVVERPFVMAGLASFLCLVPLAVTSTRGWIRRLGRRWIVLHRLVYVAAIAAIVHFLWLVKADLREPLGYAALLTLLLGARVTFIASRRQRTRPLSA